MNNSIDDKATDILFCYGILKRGLDLDLEARHCKFLGEAIIEGATLRPIGDGVGLRFDQDPGKMVIGEVFQVPSRMMPWLDTIENNGRTYTRKMVDVNLFDEDRNVSVMKAWVYEHTYPHMAYADPIPSGRFGESHTKMQEGMAQDDYDVLPRWEFGGEG